MTGDLPPREFTPAGGVVAGDTPADWVVAEIRRLVAAAEALGARLDVIMPDGSHETYWCTGHRHGIAGHCESEKRLDGAAKLPATCKWCSKPCRAEVTALPVEVAERASSKHPEFGRLLYAVYAEAGRQIGLRLPDLSGLTRIMAGTAQAWTVGEQIIQKWQDANSGTTIHPQPEATDD